MGERELEARLSASAHLEASPLIGIALVIAGVSLGGLNATLFKALTPLLPEEMITFARFASYLAIIFPLAFWRHGWRVFRPKQPGLQILRGLLQCLVTFAFVSAAVGMPVGDAVAILYIYPFALTAMAPALLGERVRKAAWVGVVGGFLGVLLIMRPDFDNIDIHALWALFCGLGVALQLVVSRKIAGVSGVIATSTFGALVGTVVSGAVVPFVWVPVVQEALLLIALLGLFSALNQSLILAAYARTEASTLAPFSYTEIIASIAIGYLWFGDFPDLVTWGGIAIIISSGILVARSSTIARALVARRRGRPV